MHHQSAALFLWIGSLVFLFGALPFSVDAEPAVVVGRAVKPAMNAQIQDILRWSGASVLSRRGGEISEPFPPQYSVILTPELSKAGVQ